MNHASQSPGRGEKILVVEDNPDVQAVAITLLEQLNYRTVAVDNAKAALNLLGNGTSVDLVFSDVMLPGDLDGLGLAEAISKRYPQTPGAADQRLFQGPHRPPRPADPAQALPDFRLGRSSPLDTRHVVPSSSRKRRSSASFVTALTAQTLLFWIPLPRG